MPSAATRSRAFIWYQRRANETRRLCHQRPDGGHRGLILSSRLGAGSPSAGNIAELDAIAACVIGGTSLAGGIGSVAGAVMGAFIMASLDNGMSMMDVPTFWQYIVKGAILLLAVWMDSATKRRA